MGVCAPCPADPHPAERDAGRVRVERGCRIPELPARPGPITSSPDRAEILASPIGLRASPIEPDFFQDLYVISLIFTGVSRSQNFGSKGGITDKKLSPGSPSRDGNKKFKNKIT